MAREWVQRAEFCVEIAAWVGGSFYLIAAAKGIMPNLPEPIAWIVAACIFLTGFSKLWRFAGRNKVS
jgi:hypothetical protein